MSRSIEIPERSYRAGMLERDSIDADGRTVELSFSSEAPVDRWWGTEILGHADGEMDDSWIGSGRAPLLVDHNARIDSQVGVIKRAWIDNGKGRAIVRFGRGQYAEEAFRRIKDGEVGNISVGYQIRAMRLEEERDGRNVYRVTSWTPLEVSLVSVPADPSVGVGRANETRTVIINLENKTMSKEENNSTAVAEMTISAETAETRSIDPQPQRNADPAAAVAAERRRVAEINKIGQKFNYRDKAEKAIDAGLSVEEFRGLVLDHLGSAAQPALSAAAQIGMTPKEVKRYSFVRALAALAHPTNRALQDAAAFEFEVSREASKKYERESRGIMVPMDVMRQPLVEKRDLTVGTATAGGHTVATDLLASSFIDALVNRMLVNTLGATTLMDLQGNVAIPRQTGGATAYWVAESGAPTESQQAFDQVTLTPRTVGAFTDYSRKLLLQSSIDIEAFVRRDIATRIALEVDRAALHGSGTAPEPRGIANTSGIGSVAGGTNGAAPTWGNVVSLETAVAVGNADIGALAYLTNAKVRGKLKQTEKASSTGMFVWQDALADPGFGMVNGYRAGVSNQVRSDLTKGTSSGICSAIFFGNWADLLIGMWSGLDLLVDPYTNSTSGTVRIVAMQDTDITVRHPESFSAMLDALTT